MIFFLMHFFWPNCILLHVLSYVAFRVCCCLHIWHKDINKPAKIKKYFKSDCFNIVDNHIIIFLYFFFIKFALLGCRYRCVIYAAFCDVLCQVV